MIVAAAIKLDGRVYGLPAPARHHDIIRMLAKRGHDVPINGEQGFIDDQFGFLDRVEAIGAALSDEQKFKREPKTQLYSEDLW